MKMKTLAIFVAAAALAVSARGETVTAEPDALLDYIEATGSQYINTGVNAETGLKAIIDFAWADEDLSGVDWSLLDACTASSNSNERSRFFMCHMTNGKPFFGYGKTRKNPAGAVSFVRGKRCEIVTDMSSTNSLELTQNGVNTFDETDRETFATNENENVNLNLNLFVFATNYGGAPNWYGKGKLYELKIFKKNATTDEFDLLRHYIPCIKGNRAGLYDKVNGTISFSFGSTNFIAGPVKITNTTGDLTLTAGGDYIVNGHVSITGNLNIYGDVTIYFDDTDGILSSCLTVGGTVRVENVGESGDDGFKAGALSFSGPHVAVYSNFTASPKVVESIIDNDTPYTAGEVAVLSGKTFTAIKSGSGLVKFSDGDIRIKRPGDGNNFKTKDNADFKMGSDYCFVTYGNTKVELKWEHDLYVEAFDKMGDARFTVKDGSDGAVSVTYGYEGGNGNHNGGASFAMPASSDVTVSARACVPVTYIDGNGAAQVCRDYTLLPTDGDDLFYYKEQKNGSDWYVSMGVTVDEDGYCLSFKEDIDVHLILCDGTATTVNVNGDHALICGGLTIYGQSGGTGALTLNTDYIAIEAYSTLTICGGSVSATSSNSKAIEVSGGDIIVKGSTLTACASDGTSSAISCSGTLRLSGGTVAATKGAIYTRYGATIAAGLAYTDGSHYYMGNIGSNDLKNLGAVTLTPLNLDVINEDGNDKSVLTPVNGQTKNIALKRTFPAGKKQTVCLPFDPSKLLTLGTVWAFTGINEGKAVMTQQTGPLSANTPYIFEATSDVTSIVFPSAAVNIIDDPKTEGGDFTFQGTFVRKHWGVTDPEVQSGIYGFMAIDNEGRSEGEFVKAIRNTNLRPFCAYLKYAGNLTGTVTTARRKTSAEELPDVIEIEWKSAEEAPGMATGIVDIEHGTWNIDHSADAWYSLDGRRLSGKPSAKGLYINNGNKVVIK